MKVELAPLVAMVESRFNQFALRFEPRLYASRPRWMYSGVERAKVLHGCSENTAWMIGATSWGLFQILGSNIYGVCGYDQNIFRFVGDSQAQLQAFEKFLRDTLGMEYMEIERRVVNDLEAFVHAFKEGERPSEFFSHTDFLPVFVRKYNGCIIGSGAFDGYVKRLMRAYIAFREGYLKEEEWASSFGKIGIKVGVSQFDLEDFEGVDGG